MNNDCANAIRTLLRPYPTVPLAIICRTHS